MKETLPKLVLVTLLLASAAVCEVVVEAQASTESENENSSQTVPIERRLKTKDKHKSNVEDNQEYPPPIIDHTEILKDSFARLDTDKYDEVIRQFEKATNNYNIMADEEINWESDFGEVGTMVHIPLHPAVFKHIMGYKNHDNDRLRARKAKLLQGPRVSRDYKRTKMLNKAKKLKLKGSKSTNSTLRKERILAASRPKAHKMLSRTFSMANRKSRRARVKQMANRHYVHSRRKSRKLRRGIPSVGQVFQKVQARNAKLGPDCGGDGITTATAIPQMFDAGITVHNYGPTPSAHPLFMDMLDQDNQPRYIDATVTIPPPRKLFDSQTRSNRISL